MTLNTGYLYAGEVFKLNLISGLRILNNFNNEINIFHVTSTPIIFTIMHK